MTGQKIIGLIGGAFLLLLYVRCKAFLLLPLGVLLIMKSCWSTSKN